MRSPPQILEEWSNDLLPPVQNFFRILSFWHLSLSLSLSLRFLLNLCVGREKSKLFKKSTGFIPRWFVSPAWEK